MKSLFTFGAWCVTTASIVAIASAQFPAPQTGSPYWSNTDTSAAIGLGVAAQPTDYWYQRDDSPVLPSQPNQAPAVQAPAVHPAAVPAPAVPAPHSHLHPQVQQPQYGHPAVPHFQSRQNLAPPSIAPHSIALPSIGRHGQVPHAQSGAPHAGIWSQDNTGSFRPAFDTGAYACEQPNYGVGRLRHGGGWFGGVGGLYMTRDNANKVWLSVDDDNITDKVMTTHDADMGFGVGFEASIGRYYCNNTRAWQLSYWGISPNEQEHSVYAGVDTVGNLGTSRTFDGLQYNGGNVADFYNDEDVHRLRRNYDFHNFEFNIMGAPGYAAAVGCGAPFGDVGGNCGTCGNGVGGCGGCSACVSSCDWRFNWLAGFRYFQFSEDFLYSSDAADTVFTGAPEEVHYDIDIENHLIGFQLGGIADYCWSSRWNFRNSIKVGAYASHINHRSRIYGSAGTATINNINSPYNGDDWLVSSAKNDVAFMAEWDTALTYQWTCNWRARMGYRAVAITGVAFAGEQIPTETYVDLGNVRIIDSNGSMILHGGYASLEYSY